MREKKKERKITNQNIMAKVKYNAPDLKILE